MTFVFTLPVFVSAIVLAAHFFRFGNWPAALACVVIPPIMIFLPKPWRKSWFRRVLQIACVAAAANWLWVMNDFIDERIAEGRSFTALVVILGSVALFNVVAAVTLEADRIKSHFKS